MLRSISSNCLRNQLELELKTLADILLFVALSRALGNLQLSSMSCAFKFPTEHVGASPHAP